MRAKMGRYFRAAGETVPSGTNGLTQPSATRSYLHVKQLGFFQVVLCISKVHLFDCVCVCVCVCLCVWGVFNAQLGVLYKEAPPSSSNGEDAKEANLIFSRHVFSDGCCSSERRRARVNQTIRLVPSCRKATESLPVLVFWCLLLVRVTGGAGT